jgi:hypothetical protein
MHMVVPRRRLGREFSRHPRVRRERPQHGIRRIVFPGRLGVVRAVSRELDRQLERERGERVALRGPPVLLLWLGPFRVYPFPDALTPVRPVQEGTDRGAQRVDAGPVRVPGQGGPIPLAGLGFAVRPRYRVGVDLGRQPVSRVLAQVGLNQLACLARMSPDRDRADYLSRCPASLSASARASSSRA